MRPCEARDERDRRLLAERERRRGQSKFTAGQIVRGLAALSKYLGSPDWLVYRYGAFILRPRPRHQWPMGLDTAVELGHTLDQLSPYEGFSQFIQGFTNPTQFEDAILEARVASSFLSNRIVQGLKFSPDYLVNGSIKHPGFEYTLI
jgi:hypothetical protein